MPNYCVDADPYDYADRKVHDLSCGICPHLPIEEHQESLGWHADLESAVAKARFWYKSARPCFFCLVAVTEKVDNGRQAKN
jgi:hypothetical protein